MTRLLANQWPTVRIRPQSQTHRRALCPHQPRVLQLTAPAVTRPTPSPSTPGKGWGLLCNGVILFDDTGELLPDGRAVPPHRMIHIQRPAAA
jgi:hypothetical protein